MTEPNNDPFNEIINGSPASPEEISIMEALALELLEAMPAETTKQIFFVDEETDATMNIVTKYYEDSGLDNTSVLINFGRDQSEIWDLEIGFGADNAITRFNFPLDEPHPVRAKAVFVDLLKSDVLTNELASITKHFLSIVDGLASDNTQEALKAYENTISTSNTHVADITRNIVNEVAGGQSVLYKEYGLMISDHSFVMIRQLTPVGFTAEELSEFKAQLLMISLNDTNTNVSHKYIRTIEGSQYTATDIQDTEYDEEDELEPIGYGDEFDQFIQTLHSQELDTDGVHLLTDALLEAKLIDSEDGEIEPGKWHYPDLYFDFDTSEFTEDGEISVANVTKEALASLDETSRIQLPEACPDGYPDQPSYRINSNLQNRLRKFLQKKVVGKHRDSDTRANVFDIHIACEEILGELSKNKDPVYQMIMQLEESYGDLIGDLEMLLVTTNIIMQTQEKKIRNLYNKKMNAWRLGNLTVNVDLE